MIAARALLVLACLALTAGCSVHKITIQQGNVITQEMVNQLEPGMSKDQVAYIMGSPVLDNTFHRDRWDYVYTIEVGSKPRKAQRLTLFFEGDELAGFEGDFVPSSADGADSTASAERGGSGAHTSTG